jgi:hypothetical protein
MGLLSVLLKDVAIGAYIWTGIRLRDPLILVSLRR